MAAIAAVGVVAVTVTTGTTVAIGVIVEIAAIVAGLTKAGFRIGALSELKTAPRGYPKDHPRIELLRRKGLTAARSWDHASWMGTRQVVKRVRESWAKAADMNAWLDAHVGPSTLAPDDDELARFGPL